MFEAASGLGLSAAWLRWLQYHREEGGWGMTLRFYRGGYKERKGWGLTGDLTEAGTVRSMGKGRLGADW